MCYLNKMRCEKGAALIVLLLVMVLGLGTYYLHTFNHAKLKRERAQMTMQALGDAKAALIAWAVSNSVNLGQLPMPDRGRGGGYDGFSDCSPSGTTFHEPASYRLLMGKLPVYGQTSPCVGQQVGLGLDNKAHLEQRFWYAVSRNVVHQYEYLSADPRSNPIISPHIIEQSTYPWLRVVDSNGQLVANRVAAVLIAPGDNLYGQSREDGAAPNQFLDAVSVDGVVYANHDYDSADEDFVMGADGTSLRFNDQLVYITADELIRAINKRVMAESKWLLSQYALKIGNYPNAADFQISEVESRSYMAGTSQTGFVPFDVTDRCECESATHCVCPFGVVASVTMQRKYGTWKSTEDRGACTSTLKASSKACTCTGAGSCSRTYASYTTRFTCDANGDCRSENLTDSQQNQFIYMLEPFADVHQLSQHCRLYRGKVYCNGAGYVDIGLNEADWLKQNNWQQYLYYVSSVSQQKFSGLLATMMSPVNSETVQSTLHGHLHDYLNGGLPSNRLQHRDVFIKTLP